MEMTLELSFLDSLADFTNSFPGWIQWLAVALLGAIPFVESYYGSVVGVLAGAPLYLAIPAAVIGNFICMFTVVMAAAKTRQKVLARRGNDTDIDPTAAMAAQETSRKRQRTLKMFNRWGVPGVSLLGQWILPSQITSGMMVSFGASPRAVIAWQAVSIVLWGAAFGGLAHLGLLAL